MSETFDLTETRQLLREHGMKATPQRLAIARLMLQEPTHATAQALYEQLQEDYPSISQNTVYLTLASFAESGLLHRFHAAGSMVFDSNTEPHDHACCRGCGRIIDLPAARESAVPASIDGWQTLSEQRTWIGTCPSCANAAPLARPTAH